VMWNFNQGVTTFVPPVTEFMRGFLKAMDMKEIGENVFILSNQRIYLQGKG
jgi:hypothetical protein